MAPFQKICQELAKLPFELAQQIICDLTVWDVLKLLWYDDPKVNAAVASHRECRRLLGEDEETFLQIQQSVKSYFGMYVKAGLPFKPPQTGYLSWGIDLLMAHQVDRYSPAYKMNIILKELKEPIHSFLHTQIYAMDLDRYVDRSVFPGGIPRLYTCTTVQDLDRCMDVVLDAKKTLFKQTSDQLYWAASMLEQNPDILKRTLDPEQKR